MAFISDLRHALRSLALRPGFTIVGALMLALGIGANTAMFSAVFHTLIRPLPFSDPHELAFVYQVAEGGGLAISAPSEYMEAWRAPGVRLQAIEQIEPFQQGEYTVQGGAEPEVMHGAAIEHGMMQMLGLTPRLGRNLLPSDLVPGSAPVVLISEGLWKRRYGGERDVIGKFVEVDETRREIVGVVPSEMAAMNGLGSEGQLWIPLQKIPGHRSYPRTLVRVRDGATLEGGAAELERLAAGVTLEHPIPGKFTIELTRPQDDSGPMTALPILLGAVGLVLLIACANLAGLLLVRLAARRREIAIRAALGAGRLRIMRHLWAEALLLALMGGVLGVLLATWGVDAVRALRPDHLGSLDAMSVDGPTLVYAAGLVVLTAILFGLLPVFSFLRGDLTARIMSSGGATARVSEGGRARAFLVVGEIAMSVVLLVGALLLVRSMQELQRVPVGFDRQNLLTAKIVMPSARYSTEETRRAFVEQVLASIEALPAVKSATATTGLPPALGMMFIGKLEVEGKPGVGEKVGSAVGGALVEPDFFETLGAPLTEGRTWASGETEELLVNARMAKMLWPGESAVGKRVSLPSRDGKPEWKTVIGVVPDIMAGSIGLEARPHMYNRLPYAWGEVRIAVRVKSGEPTDLIPSIKAILKGIDPTIPLRDAATMETLLSDNLARQRFNMSLLTLFATLAVVLSLVGLYGVISNMVSRRAHEIGIRLAIGATPQGMRRMVLREGMMLTLLGLTIGSVAAFGAVRLLKSMLFGVVPTDPVSFMGAVLVLGAGSLFACWLPARRATSVDPLTVLRSE